MNILNKEKVFHSPYLSVYKTSYEHKGISREYFHASRNKENSDKIDAVIIVATSEDENKLIITSEYRVPIQGRELSFPAGLLKEGEDPKEAAIREFKEETGMDFEPDVVSPKLFSSAGMTDESVVIVFGYATGESHTKNQEDAEDIEILQVDIDQLSTLLEEENWSKTAWPLAILYCLGCTLFKE